MPLDNTKGPYLAVVGCGAISESYYFPAIAKSPALRARVWLVDPSQARRAEAIARFGFDPALQASDIASLPAEVTAAINATPSHLHLHTTLDLIGRGVSVLLEKPLAENAADARRLVEAARGRCQLGVNQFRRMRPINQFVHEIIRSGKLGALRRISWREGSRFDWPTQSGFYFRRPWPRGRPRGALLDIGVHVLDLICWWLDAQPIVERASMDSQGGPEAYVDATLRSGQIQIDLQISFHAKLANQFVIEGERGVLRGSTVDDHQIEMESDGATRRVTIKDAGNWTWEAIARAMVANFVAAAAGEASLIVDAESVLRPMEAIDEIYEKAEDPLPACYREWVA